MHSRNYSEAIAAVVDEEISKLIVAAHQEAFDILTENRDVLDSLVVELLERETLDKAEVAEIFKPLRRRTIRPAWTGSDARMASLIADLPTASFSGTLARRFGKSEEGRGLVRAKTGTLTGVHSLAGYVQDRNGVPIAFAVMADKAKDVSDVAAEAAIDAVASALADCTCSSPS